MVQENQIAAGRVVMHARERLMAIQPRQHCLLPTTLRTRDEVVNTASALGHIDQGKPDKQMIDSARQIIEQKHGEFDPEEFTDRNVTAFPGVGRWPTAIEEPRYKEASPPIEIA